MTAAQDSREPSPSHPNTEKGHLGAEDNGKVEENISEPTYPTGSRLVLICLALCLTVFISALSNTIVATAIPTITAAFHSYDDIGWYTSGELFTVSPKRGCKFMLDEMLLTSDHSRAPLFCLSGRLTRSSISNGRSCPLSLSTWSGALSAARHQALLF